MNNNPSGATYRFLECTVSQYMTSTVQTVTRKVTLRDLEALFEKHDFNAFPVVEAGQDAGHRHQIRFPSGVCLYY